MNKDWILPSQQAAKARTRGLADVQYNEYNLSPEEKTLGVGRTYFMRTYGCQANVRDGEVMAGILEDMGYTSCEDEMMADVILLNTCAIRENAENKVFGEIGNLKALKQQRPDLILAVCGCMMQEERVVQRILSTYHQVDLIFGTHNIHRLPSLLYHAYLSKERTVEVFSQEGSIIENLPSRRFGESKAWVNIMYGCDKFCTYCIVPYTRGKERSRKMEDILLEIADLKASGFREITLLGQNVNAYGKDLGLEGGFATLLAAVAETGIERIRFVTSHPWDFSSEMVRVIAQYENIMPYIHLPLQSGDDAILKRMGRRYTREGYLELFNQLKSAIPGCAFSSDIIVGFPGESEEQFQRTLEVVDWCQFDNVYTFIYSPRSGTPAAQMEDNIPMAVKRERLQRLNERVKQYAAQNNARYMDQVVDVLVDGPSRKDSSIYCGYTDTQKLVNFPRVHAKVNEIVQIRITQPKSFFLVGEEV